MTPKLRELRHNYAFTLFALNLAIGLCYVLQSANRERSDAYTNAKHITSWLPWISALRWWGVLFFLLAALILLTHSSVTALRVSASLGLGCWLFWALLLTTSGIADGTSGFVGSVLFAAGAIRHLQVARGR